MNNTFHALATPPGTSALAVVRVCGPAVPDLVTGIFGAPPAPGDARRAKLGWYRDRDGKRIDQVLRIWFPPESSLTGRHTLEISTHGNPFLIDRVLEDLAGRGSRPAEPGEFTRTAFLEGRIDLSQAEAVGDLIAARSDAALEAAHRQLAGGLGAEVERRVEEILAIRAEVEAFIDFPEEDLPPEDEAGPLSALARTLAEIDRMIATGRQRELLHRGIRTVLVGEVNAGKSSILNRLLGERRAIVSETAGTTRDYLTDVFALGPYCIQIHDTAGFREVSDAIEREGLRQTERLVGGADFFLVVADGTAQPPTLPPALSGRLKPENALLLVNKSDAPGYSRHDTLLPALPRCEISALSGAGFPGFLDLWESRIRRELLEGAETRVLYNRRHLGCLRECREALERARTGLREGVSSECVAPDLRDALDALGAIVGTIDNEAMLDVLFGEFCIGK
ncbi:MAG: tRNA uridine-5-carboxymethylaminomethyl(34) synthesis GTPase MnmE [Puniceicoccaceae bacterium]